MMQRFEFGLDNKWLISNVDQYSGTTALSSRYNTQKLTGVSLDYTGSILGTLMDTDQGFRFGDLLGIRLDQGVSKNRQENGFNQQFPQYKGDTIGSTGYYGRIDLDFGVQCAYRLRSGADIGLRLYYEFGATLGAGRVYDHTNKIASAWVEYGRWVGEMQYGGNWNFKDGVEPFSKFKTSLRWYTSKERKFFLGLNHETMWSEKTTNNPYSGFQGFGYSEVLSTVKNRQTSLQILGGWMF